MEQKVRIKSQNEFLEEISSLTGKFSLSSNCTYLLLCFQMENMLLRSAWPLSYIYFIVFAEVSVRTLKRIKNEGVVNEGVWSTPGKKRPHQSTVSNLDSFDMDVIRNKLNEFYIVRKQVPTLRTLLAELKESIGFSGSHETLRRKSSKVL